MKQSNYIYNRPSDVDSEQPRERAISQGLGAVSDVDLMAIHLGNGTKQNPVTQMSQQVLERLDGLQKKPEPDDFLGIDGLGTIKRLQLCAAFELFRRIFIPSPSRVRSAEDLMPYLNRWSDRNQEHFFCIILNGAHEIMHNSLVSIGTLNRAIVHPREVFAPAIERRAAAIIVAHNHPSGNLEPSSEDINVTRRLYSSGELLGIPLLDHIIFSHGRWISFAEKGLISAQ